MKNIFEPKSLIGEPKRKSLFDKSEPQKAPAEQFHEEKSLNLLERKQKDIKNYNVIDKTRSILNRLPTARSGEFIADAQIAYEHLKEMKNTNKKLLQKYGKNVGAADGTDNYYHSLLQCNLAKISQESKDTGLLLGYGKEAYDYVKKKIGGMSHKNIIEDSIKDLKNNAYGSKIGSEHPNKSCRSLLNDKRPENMRKSNLW